MNIPHIQSDLLHHIICRHPPKTNKQTKKTTTNKNKHKPPPKKKTKTKTNKNTHTQKQTKHLAFHHDQLQEEPLPDHGSGKTSVLHFVV